MPLQTRAGWQAGHWIGAGLLDQIGVHRIHRRVIASHLPFVPIALVQLLA